MYGRTQFHIAALHLLNISNVRGKGQFPPPPRVRADLLRSPQDGIGGTFQINLYGTYVMANSCHEINRIVCAYSVVALKVIHVTCSLCCCNVLLLHPADL